MNQPVQTTRPISFELIAVASRHAHDDGPEAPLQEGSGGGYGEGASSWRLLTPQLITQMLLSSGNNEVFSLFPGRSEWAPTTFLQIESAADWTNSTADLEGFSFVRAASLCSSSSHGRRHPSIMFSRSPFVSVTTFLAPCFSAPLFLPSFLPSSSRLSIIPREKLATGGRQAGGSAWPPSRTLQGQECLAGY